MKAIVYTKYGPPDVLQLKEVEKPTPKDNEIRIKVYATAVTVADSRLRSFTVPTGFWLVGRIMLGIFGPKNTILGTALAGEIESIGKNVKQFKVGEKIFGTTDFSMGTHAEYVCMPEDGAVVIKPDNWTFEEAAAVSFGGTTALVFLRDKGRIQSGEKILINGASGAVGTAAVQLGKHFGANVTGVCSTTNLELVKSIGADKVIDYTKEDFTKSGETYDIILDAVGNTSFSRWKNSLKEKGRLILIVAGLPQMVKIPWASMTSSKKIISGSFSSCAEYLRFLAKLIETGKFTPIIDRCYPLERMAEAHAYVDTGRKKGNVVITLQHNNNTYVNHRTDIAS